VTPRDELLIAQGMLLGLALACAQWGPAFAELDQRVAALERPFEPLQRKLRVLSRFVGSLRPIIYRGQRAYTLGALE
jgi:hypothetical protein